MPLHPIRTHRVGRAVLTSITVLAAAAIGTAATLPNIPTWYASLHKPGFTPPNWLFGPAWSVLYLMMAVAFWRVLTLPNGTQGKRAAVAWFILQVVLNAFWSVAFFGLHSPPLGLAVIALLAAAIVMTIATFGRLDRLSAAMLVPYLLWVAFAASLNGAVFLMNR